MGSLGTDASVEGHMSERPQEAKGACKGARIQEGALLSLPARKELLLKVPGGVFYLKALFTPALSVLPGPALLYLPQLALSHTFVLQLLCFSR